ncbi:DUF2780 domain-containing protein [Pannonibacter tanglangensis]|uniref:DUF2267 domain-containing protein n=1 Tax=Pannonibacter tanglangensis TaxID=2750084 RepID=A0ABW9ZDQ3_9HYPH|nr:DUF2780 domain-containing protein [Pannonibacter sp. XCT-34]NBN62967.1 DUF2267 domain-containing protein [Pannonibacter sp. XCT-34]
MEELVARIMTAAGLGEETARTAIGIILRFLAKDGPQDLVPQIMAALPGAEAIMAEGQQQAGGLFGSIAGMMGGSIGAMATLNELSNAGLDLEQVKTVAREIVGFAREQAGEEVVNAAIARIPGLNQLV